MTAVLEVRDLRKSFGDYQAVGGVSFTVNKGELVSLLGPSGCGKTTTLRCVAGLERPSSGTVLLGGRTVSSGPDFTPPNLRDIGMVFQSYAMWPHMNVWDHLDYGLKLRRLPADARKRRVEETLSLVGLDALSRRFPSELSGGQQQRVALARALVLQPSLILFDEPLSNLDARLRHAMRDELNELKTRLSMTAVYVTHDQAEAMVLSDRIAVMSGGRIVQLDTPADLYRRPRDRFVAEFIGAANILPVRVEAGPARGACRVRFPFSDHPVLLEDADPALITTAREAAVRPEWITLGAPQQGDFKGTLISMVSTGERIEYRVRLGDQVLRVVDLRPGAVAVGGEVGLTMLPGGVSLLADTASHN